MLVIYIYMYAGLAGKEGVGECRRERRARGTDQAWRQYDCMHAWRRCCTSEESERRLEAKAKSQMKGKQPEIRTPKKDGGRAVRDRLRIT